MSVKRLVWILIPSVVLILAIVGHLWKTADNYEAKSTRETIRIEVVKSLLQLSLVIAIGGGIAALYKSAEAYRRSSEFRANLRTEYLKRLAEVYRSVKGARRSLRAIGLTTKYANAPTEVAGLYADAYTDQMRRINSAQLQLEGMDIDSQSLPALADLVGLSDCLRRMEDYLRELLNEYEEHSPILRSGGKVNFAQLQRLDEFTGETNRKFQITRYPKRRDYRLKTHFSKPFKEAVGLISRRLL